MIELNDLFGLDEIVKVLITSINQKTGKTQRSVKALNGTSEQSQDCGILEKDENIQSLALAAIVLLGKKYV